MDPKKKKKIITGSILVAFVVLAAVLCLTVGNELVEFVKDSARLRAWVEEKGFWAHIVYALIVMFQVIVAVIPGEPFELAAGYVFGAIEGTIVCLLGIVLGSILIFLAVRKWGMKIIRVFFEEADTKKLHFLLKEKRLIEITFILFLIPGTPKDIMTYFVGLTDMSILSWLVICTLARIPSVITSTLCGGAVANGDYSSAIWIFLATAAISGIGILIYNRITDKRSKENKEMQETAEKQGIAKKTQGTQNPGAVDRELGNRAVKGAESSETKTDRAMNV